MKQGGIEGSIRAMAWQKEGREGDEGRTREEGTREGQATVGVCWGVLGLGAAQRQAGSSRRRGGGVPRRTHVWWVRLRDDLHRRVLARCAGGTFGGECLRAGLALAKKNMSRKHLSEHVFPCSRETGHLQLPAPSQGATDHPFSGRGWLAARPAVQVVQ